MTARAHGLDEDRTLETAADWLVVLTSGKATEADAHDLASWREQDPRHDAAFRHVAALMGRTRALIDSPPRSIDRRSVMAGGAALVVTGGAFGLARPPLGMWPSLAELMADRRTGAGERFHFEPIAGVLIEMNSKTSLSLADRGRRIDLIAGEIFVTVGDRQGVFEVRAGGLHALSMAASFNIRSLDQSTDVTCVQGQVRCKLAEKSAVLEANDALTSDAHADFRRGRTKAAVATAWREGILVFQGTPLAEVIRQINQYRSGDIILTDAAIGDRPVSAVLHTAQIDNAVGQIQVLLNLNVRKLPGGIILIGY